MNKDLVQNFLISFGLCIKAMSIALVVSLLIGYLSELPFFKPFANFSTKFRFLPSVGLTFLFMKLTDTTDGEKLALLSYTVSTFFVTAVMGEICRITPEDRNYAKIVTKSKWKALYHLIIVGKLGDMMDMLIQVFAMAWSAIAFIENIAKSSGGIGVLMQDQNRVFGFDYVWAIQFLILLTGIGIDAGLRQLKYWLFPYTKP